MPEFICCIGLPNNSLKPTYLLYRRLLNRRSTVFQNRVSLSVIVPLKISFSYARTILSRYINFSFVRPITDKRLNFTFQIHIVYQKRCLALTPWRQEA